jgi:hypothetical protein
MTQKVLERLGGDMGYPSQADYRGLPENGWPLGYIAHVIYFFASLAIKSILVTS